MEGTDYATVGSLTLTIGTGQTAATQTFTLTPTDDDVDEASEALTVAGSTTATGLSVNPTTVSIADDDERGVEVGVTALTVSEGGDATYTVVLESEPTGDVTVAPSVSGSTEVTVSGTLTFTASTWDQAQTVTVSAQDDADAATDTATIGHAVTGGDYGANSVTADDIAVTVDDDETVSTQVTLTVNPASVSEDAGATEVTVTGTLNEGARAAPTVVTVSVGDAGDVATEGTDYGTLGSVTLTIAAGSTSGTTTFTLTPTDDDVDEASEALTVAGSTTATGLAVNATTVSIADDDERGVDVGVTALTVPEGGDATYTVVLESEPTGGVTVTPSVSGNTEVTVSGTLTFTAGTWDQAQTVTVSAAQDADAVTDTATIGHAVSGGDYGANSVAAGDIAVTVNDDETVSTQVTLTVNPASVSEDAGPTEVTVTGTLNGGARNAATVVTVSVGDAGDAATEGTDYGTLGSVTLTIAAGSTSGTQTFTLTPTDDDVDEAGEALTVAGSTTATGLAINATTVSIADDDERGVEVGVTALTVSEGGDATYTVVLESEPTGDVTVAPSVSGSTEVTVSGALTFAAGTWSTAQTVTVSAAADSDAANDTAVVSHTVSGADYGTNNVTAADVTVTVSDNETASTGVVLSVNPETVSEDAGATVVTVTGTLDHAPRLADTVVTLTVGNTGDAATEGTDYGTLGSVTLTIAAGSASGTTTFTLTPTDDDVDEGDEALTVDGSVTGLDVTAAAVTIEEDDERGVTVTPTALTVPEGESGTYTVVLTSQPTGSVTVALSRSGSSDVTVSPSPLTFTAGNWSTAQTVTVFAAVDTDAVNDTATVTHAVSGGDYGSETASDVAVTVSDDETVSTEVTLTVAPAALDEDDSATTVTVTGTLNGGARNAATVVTVSVGASNDAAVEGTDYTTVDGFTLTIDTGQTTGTASFTLTPTDDDVNEANETLTVAGSTTATGFAVNPTTVTIADDDERGVTVTPTALTVPEGGSATYTVVLASQPTGTVTVTPSVSGNSEVTVSGALTFTASDWNQAQTVTVSAQDDADIEEDVVVELAHAVSGGDYGVNDVTAASVTVTVPGFEEDAGGTVELKVPATGDPVVTVPEGASAPAGTQVTLPPGTDTVAIRMVADSDPVLAEPPQGFRAGDVVVDIEPDPPLSPGQTAVVCLPASGVDQRVHRWDDGTDPPEWVELEPPPGDPPPGLVCGVTDHFSRFALGSALGPASAETGELPPADPTMPGVWMMRFGRTVGSQVVDALGQRLEGATASHVTVGGINLTGAPAVVPETDVDDPFGLPDWATRAQREESAQSLTADDLLLGSAFHLSSGGEQGGGAAYTAWGRVARSGFEAEDDDVTMDGDVTAGLVGFDAEWERVLAGVMLSHSTGEGDYRLSTENDGKSGSVESTLTGVYPYARVALNARVSAWALAGAASGELTLRQEGDKPMPTDITMRMGAVGFKGRVLGEPGEDPLMLNMKSDAMWVGTKSERMGDMVAMQGDVTKLRLTLEGERVFAAGEGATFTPSAEVGLRHDGGDAETGTGLEVGTGLRYVAGVLTVEGKVRTLVAHEDSGYEEWGASGAVRITPSASGRGLMLRFAPQWGRTASAAERLWSAPDATALGAGGAFEGEARLALDAGYGVGLGHGRGVFTPYAALVLGDAGSRTVRTGARWQVGADAVLELEGTRRTSGTGEGDNLLMLRLALRF